MGLDVSHNAWSGAYSAFTRWRNKLAEVAGYEVAKIDRSIPGNPDHLAYIPIAIIDWGHIEDKNYYGEWDTPPADPLIVLIAHSDCEGVIHPTQAVPLADRLEELLLLLPAEPDHGHVGDWRETTEQFIRGLRQATDDGEDLVFA